MRLATLWLCFLPTFVMAQTITYANPAPVPQAGWMTFTLPIESAPDFGTLGGQPCFGGRTVGSARVMHALVRMDGFEHRTEEFRAAAAQPEAGRLTTPQVTPQIGNMPMSSDGAVTFGHSAVTTHHSVVRQGSFVFELWVDWFPGDSPAQWELLVSFSDPTTSAIEAQLPKIELRLPAPWAAMPLWAPWRAARVEAGSTVLADGGPIRDSQGLAWRGVLVRTDTPAHGGALWGLPMGVADAATWEGHWGPFGVVPTGGAMYVGSARKGDAIQTWINDAWFYAGQDILKIDLSTGAKTVSNPAGQLYGSQNHGKEFTLLLLAGTGNALTLGNTFIGTNGSALGTIAAGTTGQTMTLAFTYDAINYKFLAKATPQWV